MADTVKQVESKPAAYPASPSGLSDKAAALDASMIWQRIESYSAYRYSVRDVFWIVEGAGHWSPPLASATVTLIEGWNGTAFDQVFPAASPYGGYDLATGGPYRITGQVGAGPVPAAVNEAFRRLAEYYAGGRQTVNEPGASKYSFEIADGMSWDVQRNPAWMARAMQNSGAADLLRPYRRAQ